MEGNTLGKDIAKERKKLNLPMDLTEETSEIIGEMWAKNGSIRDCKDVGDFGRYRFALVKLFDKKIRELKKELI